MSVRVGILLLALGLAGCANQRDRVVLLPGPDGRVGHVAVNPGSTETVLDQPYGSASVTDRGKVERKHLDEDGVRRDFAEVLAALPPRPVSYMHYFQLDSDQLTPDSEQQA